MKRGSAVLRVVSLGGLALAGLVGGHALGYAIAIPDAHHRVALIARTGHGYLPSLSWAAVVCGLAALVAGIGAGYVGRGSTTGDWRRPAFRIVSMQAAAFVLIEIIERLASRASLASLSPSLLLVGVAVQLLVGMVVAVLLTGLRKMGSALRPAPSTLVRAPIDRLVPRARVYVRRSLGRDANRVRSPPPAHALT
jgi:F0F1-type ATP synthase membrane subunit c/vacuolar-type H+-ATPase subunit K